MIIGGLQKFSMLDYPGLLAAIIFTEGCNFRCGFCYNPMLVLPKGVRNKKGHSRVSEDDLFVFLKERIGKLEGIVITGGEPTLHKDLPEFIRKIKALGFKIKLDTNGTNPKMLLPLLIKERDGVRFGGEPLIDYIAMDIKAPLEKYGKITGVSGNQRNLWPKIQKSIKLIIDSGLPHEFRTTVVPGLIKKLDIKKMGELIKGADKWFLQQFNPNTDLVDKKFQKVKPYTSKELEEMRMIGEGYAKWCRVR